MDLEENSSLSYLFNGYIDDPEANVSVRIFYEIMMDILEKRSKMPNGLLRGDIINVDFLGEYKQDGWFFWNGKDIIKGTKISKDTYTIPETFRIFEEFPPSYWDKFPFDSSERETVMITKNLLSTYDNLMVLKENYLFTLFFKGNGYMLAINKDFAEKVRDSNPSEKFFLKNTETP